MAKIGIKCPVAATISGYNSSTGMPTYSAGFIIGKAITAEKSIESNSNPLYADDSIVENDSSFASGTIKLGVSDFGTDARDGLVVQSKMLGNEFSTLAGNGYMVRRGATQIAPYLGFGFYKTKIQNNKKIYEATWLYKTQWKTPSDSTTTKGQSIEWQTPEIEGTVMAVESFGNEIYEDTVIFETQAAAISWLFEKAVIEANADRTSLTSLVSTINSLDPESYTSVSWAALNSALTNTRYALTKTYMSETEVDTLYNILNTAYTALQERDTE